MPDKRDNVTTRGIRGSSPPGTLTFIGLRSLDIFIQYRIIAKGLADPLLKALHVIPLTTSAPLVAFGMPLRSIILLAMAAGSALKQNYTLAFITQEEMPVSTAMGVSFFNTIFNSLSSIVSLTAAASYFAPSLLSQSTNEHGISPMFIAGTALYVLGIMTEAISETQRRIFKNDPKNAGKPYTGGLFGLARHINYGGYTVWRTGYAMAAGGLPLAALVATFFSYDFITRGIPVLDHYCTDRYGASWAEYKKKTTFMLLPGLY